MGLGRGSGIDVETDTELSEGLLYQLMVFVHDILRRAALLAGLNGDGHPMLIRSAHEEHVPAAHSQVPDVDISGNVDSRQVSDVNRSVGIRQSGRNKITLKFLHILSVFLKNAASYKLFLKNAASYKLFSYPENELECIFTVRQHILLQRQGTPGIYTSHTHLPQVKIDVGLRSWLQFRRMAHIVR